jgi:hypothetical protein
MERRDHLLRQIEALGRILSRLRELITHGDTAEAQTQLQDEMKTLGLDLATASAVDAVTLRMLLGGPVLDPRKAFAVGALLHLDAMRARADGDESRTKRSETNALVLLTEARSQLDGDRAAMADEIISSFLDYGALRLRSE